MAGLYFHVPFCKQACYYCDFHFSTNTQSMEALWGAMRKEMLLQKDFLREPVETLYFGGGTPSLLPEEMLAGLVQTARALFPVSDNPEITLEANPDDLSPEKLKALKKAGINRLSVGIQSFQPDILKFLHRAHDADAARRCLRESREAGFQNINVDLIYAIPGLDLDLWQATLEEAMGFRPFHLSLYALTIEERTVFGNWHKKGKIRTVSDDLAARQFERLQEVLHANGYEHYEISNAALPGFHARHNSNYWLQRPYLGIGPSAHSYDGSRRLINVPNNARYIKALAEDKSPAETETLTPEDKINEFILTRLRTRWGCDMKVLREEHNDELMTRCGTLIRRYEEQDLLTVHDEILRLTRKGMLLADQVTQDLMIG